MKALGLIFPTLRFVSYGLVFFVQNITTFALPIDWNGSLAFESIRVNNFTHTKGDVSGNEGVGSQIVNSDGENAFIQNYVFRLNPNIIVNDHVTVKGEFSVGDARGNLMGREIQNSREGDFGTPRLNGATNYYQNQPAGNSALNVNQLYMEIYSDTATYKVGRFARHWGLGAMINRGNDPVDKFFSAYEGIEARVNIGNFYITPYLATFGNGPKLTRDTEAREIGLELMYDNPNKDLKLGAHLSKRRTGGNNQLLGQMSDPADPTGTFFNQGVTGVKLIDVFFMRYFGDLRVGVEVPMVSGDFGNVYDSNTESSIDAMAFIAELGYEFSPTWEVSANLGHIQGDKGDNNTFNAIFLHPNYHIAEIMFRYNLNAVNDTDRFNVFESSLSNMKYLRLASALKSGLWTWNAAFIVAKANETAASGQRAFHHQRSYAFNAVEEQSDDLGWEIDLGFEYQWNPNLIMSGYTAYYNVGDYYAFTNGNGEVNLANDLSVGIRLGLRF